MKNNGIMAAVAVSSLLTGASLAGSFTWSNTVLSTNLQSDGAASPNITFEIIVPGAGFDLADPTSWNASNFTSFDSDTYNLNSLNNYGSTSVTAPDNLLAGSQVWIFGYNDLNLMGQVGGEAVLFTDSGWLLPDPDPAIPNAPDTWTPNDAEVVAFGAVDPSYRNSPSEMNTPGSELENLGTFTDPNIIGSRTEPTGLYEFQTFTWTVVPEPGTALLSLLSGLLLLRRKR